jgi:hypothetical protein
MSFISAVAAPSARLPVPNGSEFQVSGRAPQARERISPHSRAWLRDGPRIQRPTRVVRQVGLLGRLPERLLQVAPLSRDKYAFGPRPRPSGRPYSRGCSRPTSCGASAGAGARSPRSSPGGKLARQILEKLGVEATGPPTAKARARPHQEHFDLRPVEPVVDPQYPDRHSPANQARRR